VSPNYNNHLREKDFRLEQVPGRTGILIHRGNFAGDRAKGYRSDVDGCILVGSAVIELDGQKAVSSSRHTLAEMVRFVGDSQFSLTIK
jgi:hypothetical protein